MNARSLRVLAVDDSRNFSDAAMAFLATEPRVELIGSLDSASAAIGAAAFLRPDLVLMDMDMPDVSGLSATRAIKRLVPGVMVVVVTLHDGDGHRAAALEAGADGFISKAAFAETLPRLLADVMDANPQR